MIGSTLALGFLLGMRHAFEPDHVAAVASLSTRATSRKGFLMLAAGWGVGHTLTILVVAVAAIVAGARLPAASSEWLERLVGFVLLLLGAGVVRRAALRHLHLHPHDHGGGRRHVHLHVHEPGRGDRGESHDHGHSGRGVLRALAMGTLHGLAGSAALMLVVLPGAEGAGQALVSLALFGAGSIGGMLLFSVAIAFPLRIAGRFRAGTAALEGGLGAVTMVVGARILFV